MSRIGKMPVELPQGVDAKHHDGRLVVKGPNGELSLDVHPEMSVAVDDGEIRVERPTRSSAWGIGPTRRGRGSP